tara:strand:- start:18275 stop:18466 length:192 start_codon:yes stop_codon:yes gene_type:complete
MITERQMKIAILVEILADMDVPGHCMELSKRNIRWLLRNLRVRNNDHTDIELAIATLKELAKA